MQIWKRQRSHPWLTFLCREFVKISQGALRILEVGLSVKRVFKVGMLVFTSPEDEKFETQYRCNKGIYILCLIGTRLQNNFYQIFNWFYDRTNLGHDLFR